MRQKIAYLIKHLPIIGKRYPAIRAFIENKQEELIHYYDAIFVDYSKRQPIKTAWGFLMHIGHGRYHRMMAQSSFEIEETALIEQLLIDTDIYIDVGANIGFYVLLARSLGKRVLAIEPQMKNLKVLYASLEINNFLDVEVYPMGLAEKPGLMTLYGSSSTGASLIEGWNAQPAKVKEIIPLTTLDAITSRFINQRLLIKIDVEGAEHLVLQGAQRLVKDDPKPKWLIEITLNEYYPAISNPNYYNTFNFFWQNGYEIHTADKKNRLVLPEDVSRWIKNGKNDFGVINYIVQ